MTTTAIIPCYNAESFLGEAIESVLRQTQPVDEIIVVDDGSTDGSRDVARRYPVQVLTTASNSGHAAARNIGINAAKGDTLVWLDADDSFEPEHVEVICGLLERFPEAAVAFSAVRLYGARAGVIGERSPCSGSPRNVFWESLRNTVVPAMSAATRRDALLSIGGYNAAIRTAPDYDLWLRLSRRHLFVSTPQVTANYRQHGGQISATPLRQVRSVYQSRWRYYASLVHDGEVEFAAQVAAAMLQIWEEDLRRAWQGRHMTALRFHLGLSEFVPGGSRVARSLRRRAWLPRRVMCGWDRWCARLSPRTRADGAHASAQSLPAGAE